jgi:hypothetical protein
MFSVDRIHVVKAAAPASVKIGDGSIVMLTVRYCGIGIAGRTTTVSPKRSQFEQVPSRRRRRERHCRLPVVYEGMFRKTTSSSLKLCHCCWWCCCLVLVWCLWLKNVKSPAGT